MAIEDGLCLAELIHAEPDDFATAFRRFEAARVVRTARVQLESRALWNFYHAEGIARECATRPRRHGMRSTCTTAWRGSTMAFPCRPNASSSSVRV